MRIEPKRILVVDIDSLYDTLPNSLKHLDSFITPRLISRAMKDFKSNCVIFYGKDHLRHLDFMLGVNGVFTRECPRIEDTWPTAVLTGGYSPYLDYQLDYVKTFFKPEGSFANLTTADHESINKQWVSKDKIPEVLGLEVVCGSRSIAISILNRLADGKEIKSKKQKEYLTQFSTESIRFKEITYAKTEIDFQYLSDRGLGYVCSDLFPLVEHLHKQDSLKFLTFTAEEPEYDSYMQSIGDLVALDTETTGLQMQQHGSDKTIGVSIASDINTGAYIPINPNSSKPSIEHILCDPNTDKVFHNCFTRDTKVLKSDLTWVKIGELNIGDILTGVEEGVTSPPKDRNHHSRNNFFANRRSWKKSTVLKKVSRMCQAIKVVMSDGTEIVTTEDHPFLCLNGGKWDWKPIKKHYDQSKNNIVAKALDVWEEDLSKEAGWLAGMWDGEGCISSMGFSASQCEGEVLNKIKNYLDTKNFKWVSYKRDPISENHKKMETIRLKYGNQGNSETQRETLRFLGEIRPTRFIEKWWGLDQGVRFKKESIVSIESVGVREVINLETSSGTYIVEGFPVHNCKFDLAAVKHLSDYSGIQGNVYDTMIAAYLLGYGGDEKRRGKLGLKALTSNLLDYEMTLIEDLRDKEGNLDLSSSSIGQIAPYAAADAIFTLRLWEKLKPELIKNDLWDLFELEMNICRILLGMEETGVYIHLPGINSARTEATKDLSEQKQKIYECLPSEAGTYDIDSSSQLSHILFKIVGLTPVKSTPTGLSVDKEVLAKLESEHPIIPMIQEYKQLKTIVNMFLVQLPKHIGSDGRFHTSYNQCQVVTGRLSSRPNLMAIPSRGPGKIIRSLFRPRKGYVYVGADFSQLEIRIMAHYSQDPLLMEEYVREEETGIPSDVYSRIAAEIYEVSVPEVTTDMRNKTKILVLGTNYGLSEFGFSRRSGMSLSDSKEFQAKYFERMSGIKNYMKEAVKYARLFGESRTILNRRRLIPDINSELFGVRSEAERHAINLPIQGSASDIVKLSMDTFESSAKVMGYKDAKLIMQLHDENIVECPKEMAEEIKYLLQESMEGAGKLVGLRVPLRAEAKIGESWSDIKE